MPKGILKDIKTLADADRRKITEYIILVLEDHIESKKAPKK